MYSLSVSRQIFKKKTEFLFSGVHLQDLVFIEDGNPNSIGNLINWRKCNYVASIVSLIQLFQSTQYNMELTLHREFQYFLEHSVKMNDLELYERSTLCEPKNAVRGISNRILSFIK